MLTLESARYDPEYLVEDLKQMRAGHVLFKTLTVGIPVND
jgi:hypothetical protein